MQKITPCLWFDDKAEEAAKFYVSIFKHSKFGHITRYGEAGAEVSGRPKGSVMTERLRSRGRSSWPSTADRFSSLPRRSRSW